MYNRSRIMTLGFVQRWLQKYRFLVCAGVCGVIIIAVVFVKALTRISGIQWQGTKDLNEYLIEEQIKAVVSPVSKPFCLSARNSVNISGNNVISMSLWGSNPRYVIGVLRNSVLIQTHFPGWKLRVYVEKESSRPTYEPVPRSILQRLRHRGVDIIKVDEYRTLIPPMMWRFLVADDLSVDHFLIRDSDSRLSSRDAVAVSEWLKSKKAFHCIRDHPSHALWALSGGLWGGRPKQLKRIKGWIPISQTTAGWATTYLKDMEMLGDVIWPLVKDDDAYCSDSVSCNIWEASHPFSIPRYGLEHCGAVYDADDKLRLSDLQVLIEKGENQLCIPA